MPLHTELERHALSQLSQSQGQAAQCSPAGHPWAKLFFSPAGSMWMESVASIWGHLFLWGAILPHPVGLHWCCQSQASLYFFRNGQVTLDGPIISSFPGTQRLSNLATQYNQLKPSHEIHVWFWETRYACLPLYISQQRQMSGAERQSGTWLAFQWCCPNPGDGPLWKPLDFPREEYSVFSTDEDQCLSSSGMMTNAFQDSLMLVQSGFLPSTTKWEQAEDLKLCRN